MSASFANAVIPRLLCKKKRSLSSQQLSEEKHEPSSITSEDGFKFLPLGEGDQEADLEKTEASFGRRALSTSKYVGLICIPDFSTDPEQMSAQLRGFEVPCNVSVCPSL